MILVDEEQSVKRCFGGMVVVIVCAYISEDDTNVTYWRQMDQESVQDKCSAIECDALTFYVWIRRGCRQLGVHIVPAMGVRNEKEERVLYFATCSNINTSENNGGGHVCINACMCVRVRVL